MTRLKRGIIRFLPNQALRKWINQASVVDGAPNQKPWMLSCPQGAQLVARNPKGRWP